MQLNFRYRVASDQFVFVSFALNLIRELIAPKHGPKLQTSISNKYPWRILIIICALYEKDIIIYFQFCQNMCLILYVYILKLSKHFEVIFRSWGRSVSACGINLETRIITSERSEPNSHYQSYMGRIDDIQTALRPIKNRKKIEINFHGHFRTSLIF